MSKFSLHAHDIQWNMHDDVAFCDVHIHLSCRYRNYDDDLEYRHGCCMFQDTRRPLCHHGCSSGDLFMGGLWPGEAHVMFYSHELPF